MRQGELSKLSWCMLMSFSWTRSFDSRTNMTVSNFFNFPEIIGPPSTSSWIFEIFWLKTTIHHWSAYRVPGREGGWHWRRGASHPLQGRTIAGKGPGGFRPWRYPNSWLDGLLNGKSYLEMDDLEVLFWGNHHITTFTWIEGYLPKNDLTIFHHIWPYLIIFNHIWPLLRCVLRKMSSGQVQVGSGYHDFDEYFLSAIEAQQCHGPSPI